MAAQTARNVITQAIREEEKNIVFRSFRAKEKDIITGIIKKKNVSNISQKQLDEQVKKIREEGARKNKSAEEIEAEIKNIKNSKDVKEQLSELVDKQRDAKRVSGREFLDGPDSYDEV